MSKERKPQIRFPHNGTNFRYGRNDQERQVQQRNALEDIDRYIRGRIDGGRIMRKEIED